MRIEAAVMEKPDGLVGRRRIRIEQVELEGPRADEVLVRVTGCGVCGTDRGCIHGQMPYPAPAVLGHEGAGVVEAVGRDCTLVNPGDRVVMGFPYCGATHTLASDGGTVDAIKDLTGGGVDYAIESTNGMNLVAETCQALTILGTAAVVGGSKPTANFTLNHSDLEQHGKRVIGVLGGGGQPDFLVALMQLQAQGRFPVEKLVRTYDFADVNQAIDDSDAGAVVKPILRMAA